MVISEMYEFVVGGTADYKGVPYHIAVNHSNPREAKLFVGRKTFDGKVKETISGEDITSDGVCRHNVRISFGGCFNKRVIDFREQGNSLGVGNSEVHMTRRTGLFSKKRIPMIYLSMHLQVI